MSKKRKPIPSVSGLMLALARTCKAKRDVLAKFHESELIGIVWFASVPDVFKSNPCMSDGFLYDEHNLHAGAFWGAYTKHPDEVLEIVGLARLGLGCRRRGVEAGAPRESGCHSRGVGGQNGGD